MSEAESTLPYHKGVKHLYEKGQLQTVPNKYILPASERPTVNNLDHPNVATQKIQLPIIDFAELLGPNRPQVLKSLANACQHYGFFQLVNHSIPDDVLRSIIDVIGSFSQTKDTVFCWRDFLKLICRPLPDFLPHWPSSPVDFREVVATYAEETKELFMAVMEGILESLGIMEANQEKENIMKELENGSQMLVANFYPPCPSPDSTLGMHPHSDYGFLTLLLQDEVEGLQIQYQGKWVTVQPIPNAFVVNIGDHLEIYSNGKYKSVLHRVLVNEVKSRVSVASFHSLPFNCTVRACPTLIDEANPKRYMDTDFASFLSYVSTREAKKKDFLDSRKLTCT
ncbi:Oxoglutarate/iron-dependent dioxygenase [Sesbania bispinosa]|nr:Oxoglutarate/iron-dependent dioxygenase [Sesbania bispinosa]